MDFLRTKFFMLYPDRWWSSRKTGTDLIHNKNAHQPEVRIRAAGCISDRSVPTSIVKCID